MSGVSFVILLASEAWEQPGSLTWALSSWGDEHRGTCAPRREPPCDQTQGTEGQVLVVTTTMTTMATVVTLPCSVSRLSLGAVRAFRLSWIPSLESAST